MGSKRTIFVDDQLHHQLKVRTTQHRITMTQVLESEIRKWLASPKRAAPEPPSNGGLSPRRTKNVFLEDDLHLALKSECVINRWTITDVVEDRLRNWLDAHPPPGVAVT